MLESDKEKEMIPQKQENWYHNTRVIQPVLKLLRCALQTGIIRTEAHTTLWVIWIRGINFIKFDFDG
jgi:hypothetical protein